MKSAKKKKSERERERDTYTFIFIEALITIDKTWCKPGWPSTDECIKKIWYIYIWDIFQPRRTKSYHLKENGQSCKISGQAK
jgi:hypothetical protein